jgi:hypothetical protein
MIVLVNKRRFMKVQTQSARICRNGGLDEIKPTLM